MPVGGRVAGKVGIYSSHYNGNVDVDIIALGTYKATLYQSNFWCWHGGSLFMSEYVVKIASV